MSKREPRGDLKVAERTHRCTEYRRKLLPRGMFTLILSARNAIRRQGAGS